MKAKIFEIKRFAVHDGDGIRTTVFFKGCPLKCVWCHNPEGLSAKTQLAYYFHKCTMCGECMNVCPNKAHFIADNKHIFNREKCIACGKCEKECFNDALKLYGKEMTVDELLPHLLEDREFFENSGGGVTLSGGECLLQADFCQELLKQLKSYGINTAIDTCGYVSREAFDKVIPYTDTFLYDIKAIDEEVHIKCTGHSNKIILDNLKYIDSCNKNIEIRIPYVPMFNDGEMEKVSEFLKDIKNVKKVRVLPYHNYAGSKYESLGIVNNLPPKIPTDEEVILAQELFNRF